MIAPSHGIIWRTHVDKIIKQYSDWVANKPDKKAVIIFDTMWKSTEIIASTLLDIFEEKGYKCVYLNLQNNHISDVITEVLSAEYICVGSPTLNNNIMPNVAAFLVYLKGLSPKKRKAIAFGSYGWSGQSVGQVEEYLKEAGLEVIDSVRLQYIPDEKELAEAKERILGKI